MTYKPPYTIPEILQMRLEGKAYSEIALRFGISRSRVGQIVKRERQRTEVAERSVVIRNEMRGTKDVGRKLSIDDLFCVLNLPGRPRAVLRAHFNRQGITEFSLRDMMDFLIPIVETPRNHHDLMPAYRVRMLGQVLYAAMIEALSAVDCGEAFHAEWAERKEGLRKYLTALREPFPYLLHGKDPALMKRQ